LKEGELLKLGALRGEVWLTEGHLNGHISFIFWNHASGARPQRGDRVALFCGDTLFAAGCGRLFDGPASSMYQSLQRFGELPKDTLVFPAHEYTLDNLKFACHVKPDDDALQQRLASCEEVRAAGRATLPSEIRLERSTNLFMRAPDVDHFANLRAMKDRGVHRQEQR
jgi:hydroxyacylglutathione hydrolase